MSTQQPPPGEIDDAAHSVGGRVIDAAGWPATGLAVRAFDRDLRREQQLGEGLSDAKGRYRISYAPRGFARAEKDSADLVVRVFDRDGRRVAQSPILFNAGPESTVDLVLADDSAVRPSEFEQLVAELTPLLCGLALKDLREDEEHDDVTFLSGETGRRRADIAMLAVAHRLDTETKVPAAAFYGMFREGLPSQLRALLAQSSDVQRRALIRAAVGNLIPRSFEADADKVVASLKSAAVRLVLAAPGSESDHAGRLPELLALPLEKASLRQEFLETFARHEGSPDAAWDELEARTDFEGLIDDVQLTLQLGALTGNHPPLVRELRSTLGARKDATLADLARFDEQDWLELIRKPGPGAPIGAPPEVPGKDADERERRYAAALEQGAEEAFPTHFLAHRLERDEAPAKQDVAAFLAANPDFDMRGTQLTPFLRANPKALDRVKDPERTANELRAIQRAVRLTSRARQANVLVDIGLASAAAINDMGERQFVARHADAMGGTAEATRIFATAQETHETAFGVALEMGPWGAVAVHATPDETVPEPDGVPDWLTLFGAGSLCECEHCRSVYGPAAYLVDVLHFLRARASKIAGASAVHVLFGRHPDDPVIELIDRRSDIGEIELTCENTNTPLPYVDLVNEVLEDAVAPLPAFTAFALSSEAAADVRAGTISQAVRDAFASPFAAPLTEHAVLSANGAGAADAEAASWAIDEPGFTYTLRQQNGAVWVTARGRQTKGSAADRAVGPQYVNLDAYAVLRNAAYPWTLPFDLPAEEIRIYLDHLGIARQQIVESFATGARPAVLADPALVRAQLGLTYRQAELIVGRSGVALWTEWGFAQETLGDESWTAELRAGADVFLARSGLRYIELLELLDTSYANPELSVAGPAITIVAPEDDPGTCDPAKLRLEGLHEGAAERIVRFVRLWRALGWSMRDVDRAIAALPSEGVGEIHLLDDTFLTGLSHVRRLQEMLGVSVPVLLSWWAPIGVARYVDRHADEQPLLPSQYEQLFRDRATADPPDPAFAEDPDDLAGPLTGRPALAAALCAALQLDASELDLLLASAVVFPRDPADPSGLLADTLDLENLSRLHRHVTLARALRLTIENHLVAVRVAGVDPFRSTTDTVLFAETVGQVRATGFSWPELDYLLHHTADPTGEIAPSDASIADFLTELRAALHRVDRPDAPIEPLVAQLTAQTLRIEPRSAAALLSQWLASPADTEPDIVLRRRCIEEFLPRRLALSGPVTRGDMPGAFAAFVRLHKAALVASRLKLGHRQLRLVFDHGSAAGWLDLNVFPTAAGQPAGSLDDMLRLASLARLTATRPSEEAVAGLFALARDVPVGAPDSELAGAKHAWLDAAARWKRCSRADLEVVLGRDDELSAGGALQAAFPDDYRDERLLARLGEVLGVLQRLGTPVQQAIALAASELDESAARGLRQALCAKYDVAHWRTIARPLRDGLRERQRAALVSYLVTHDIGSRRYGDANELFAHFLIDVEMSPCMRTSRIKQAIGSAQLFVQRCHLGLEPDVAVDASDERWREWGWRKRYRLWEANRKVLLYPENWIEPELRDDKSPIFRELESELLQGDLTLDSAQQALTTYLTKLDEVARLQIVGLHRERAFNAQGATTLDILHVFARTPATPHVYYYRQRIDSAYWTPWERLDLNIQGDHLIPVVWNGRLRLIWPVFRDLVATPDTVSVSDGTLAGLEPERSWEIGLAWSDRKSDGDWTAQRSSSTHVAFATPPALRLSPSDIMFRTATDDEDNLLVGLNSDIAIGLGWAFGFDDIPLAMFRFDSPQADPTLVEGRLSADRFNLVTGIEIAGMMLRELDERSLYLPAPTDTEALARTPGTFRLLPHADGSPFTECPFVYQDDSRAFLVIPSPIALDVGGLLRLGRQIAPDITAELPASRWRGLATASAILPPVHPRDPPLYPSAFEAPASRIIGALRPLAASLPAPAADPVAHVILPGGSPRIPPSVPRHSYRFQTFYHPFTRAFVRELGHHGVDGLLQRVIQMRPTEFLPRAVGTEPPAFNFVAEYAPQRPVVGGLDPVENVDFDNDGAYALYNWELFFHVPLLIADSLRRNERYEEAQQWFHFIFDPTDRSSLSVPQRYWRTKPFFERSEAEYLRERIEYLLPLLARAETPAAGRPLSPDEQADLARFRAAIDRWRGDAFNPHLVARLRTTAFQKAVVMKYLDNLIAWGDQLFRRDTIEANNEATQLYVLAAELLGRRPEIIPPRTAVGAQTYNELAPALDDLANALVDQLGPGSHGPRRAAARGGPSPPGLGQLLYFCVPQNEKLLGYWDTVADRLFKLRHCMNIEGVVRELPLFEPPIDPGLLVRARAAGVDLDSAVADTGRPSHYRFAVLVQHARELCSEVKALGQSLLAALEKRDGEHLSMLRSTQETALLDMVEHVREMQLAEAEESIVALQRSRDAAITRYLHYQGLMGVQSPAVPAVGEPIAEGTASALVATQEEGGTKLIGYEREELSKLAESQGLQDTAGALDTAAALAHIAPRLELKPMGIGTSIGGFGDAIQAIATGIRTAAGRISHDAGRVARLGQYALRAHDWLLQSNMAAREIMQIDQQILTATIRSQIVTAELANHRRQIADARAVLDFFRDKYTSEDLYGWMVGQLATVHFQTYQLAVDLARRAERSFRHELGLQDSSFIQFGYWDSLRKGLLAGERLQLDLNRMEIAYLDANRRELEITKHVSVAQLAPLSLVELRQTGSCTVQVPEALFDLDYPGHYLRRLKTVSLTIPCVTGPYTGVSCTLRLIGSSVRHSSDARPDRPYARQPTDERFTDYPGSIERIVTSAGRDDSGMFELNLRDERYLPFEGAGAISTWEIELPADFRQFDYDTISDVVLHLRYTASASDALKPSAAADLARAVNEYSGREGEQGPARLFSLRHEFPSQWSRFVHGPAGDSHQTLTAALTNERFPYLFQNKTITISGIELLARVRREHRDTLGVATLKLALGDGDGPPGDPLDLAVWSESDGVLLGTAPAGGAPSNWTLTAWHEDAPGARRRIDPDALEDILLLCRFRVS